jgi:hypothetical protein
MKPRRPIPTGLHHSAQSCRVREATLGQRPRIFPQPQRGCITARAHGFNPVGVGFIFPEGPRVARASQPWADGCSPVGAEEDRAFPSTESRTLATLRDTLLPKLLSGELSVAGVESKLEAAR